MIPWHTDSTILIPVDIVPGKNGIIVLGHEYVLGIWIFLLKDREGKYSIQATMGGVDRSVERFIKYQQWGNVSSLADIDDSTLFEIIEVAINEGC